MSTGKIASQSGHAAIGAFRKAPKETQEEYHGEDGIGTKVCLNCPSLDVMLKYYAMAQEMSLPSFLVVDTGNNGFGGVSTPTTLGIGPLNRAQARFLKKLELMK